MNPDPVIYCPACNRDMLPVNMADYLIGWDRQYVYIHDPVPHELQDDDYEAMKAGLQ